uniref:Putative LOC101237761 [Hydra vulgaris] n=1 Tax=Lepeophtheirus salmonis TaxID=72036 RepID=A0A0K2TCJ0_LEPSM
MLGVKWLQGFRSRHAVLCLQKPEKTSIAKTSDRQRLPRRGCLSR